MRSSYKAEDDMRRLVMILLTMVLVCVGSSAHASIIYTVSVTGVSSGSQTETLTGTITNGSAWALE